MIQLVENKPGDTPSFPTIQSRSTAVATLGRAQLGCAYVLGTGAYLGYLAGKSIISVPGHLLQNKIFTCAFGRAENKKKTITQNDLKSCQSTLICSPATPLPSAENRNGALLTLASFLNVFGLEIRNADASRLELVRSQNQLPKVHLTDAQITLLTTLLQKPLLGKVPEEKLNRAIIKAFKQCLNNKRLFKEVNKHVFYSKGILLPAIVESTTEHPFPPQTNLEGTFTLKERLEAVRKDASSWAMEIDGEKHFSSHPLNLTKLSAVKNDRSLEKVATNLHIHRVSVSAKDVGSSEKAFVRHGAPYSYPEKNEKNTLKLIQSLEKTLNLEVKETDSAYVRLKHIRKAVYDKKAYVPDELIETLRVVEKRLSVAKAQMADILQAAHKLSIQQNKPQTGPFIHAEISLLSPGNAKETPIVLESEMAMDCLSQEYEIAQDSQGGFHLKHKSEPKTRFEWIYPRRKIAILLIQKAINEHQITDSHIQEHINMRACRRIMFLLNKGYICPQIKSQIEFLVGEIQKATTHTHRSYCDRDILHLFHAIFELMNITTGIFCKSGKDRTAQAVADLCSESLTMKGALGEAISKEADPLETAPLLNRSSQAFSSLKTVIQKQIQKGISYSLTFKNTGKDGYALGWHQLMMMPFRMSVSPFLCSPLSEK